MDLVSHSIFIIHITLYFHNHLIDLNNKTFHNSIKTRKAQNAMKEIRCANGDRLVRHNDIKVEAERFFSDLLTQTPSNYQGASVEELKELLKYRCKEEDCRQLEADVTDDEIRRVLFSMPSNKSPGPDGFPCEFFKFCLASTGW